jgi:hypothetical protein
MMNKFGVVLSPPDERDYPVSVLFPEKKYPDSVRLDNKILAIRDQGFWPTCVGKAGATIMSAGFGVEVSSIYLFAKCKEVDLLPADAGTFPRLAMKVMQKQGCCLDKMLPYLLMNNPLPKITGLHDVEAEQRKITAYARVRSLDDIKQALVNKRLVMGVILVGDNFTSHRGDKVIGLPAGNKHGYHAITICGYDDQVQAVRVANTWGTRNWGDGGFAWLSYEYLNSMINFPEAWVVEIKKSAEEFYPDRIFRLLKKN